MKSSHFRPAVIRHLHIQTTDQSKQLYGKSSPGLPQAAGSAHVWLATTLLLIAWQSAEVLASPRPLIVLPGSFHTSHGIRSLRPGRPFYGGTRLETPPTQVTSEFLMRILDLSG